MTAVSLQDSNFLGDAGISKMQPPSHIEWDRYGIHDQVVFTDYCLGNSHYSQWNNSGKIGLILEPYSISPGSYQFVRYAWDKFDRILLHHKDWVKNIPNAVWYPNLMTWIEEKDRGIPEKTKDISFLLSQKTITPMQRLRHNIKGKINVDKFGDGAWVENKADTLLDYRFSVVIENASEPGYFSEKIIDCFLTGTIPIYIGDPDIGDYFDLGGILVATPEDIVEVVEKTKQHSENIYEDARESVLNNFEKINKMGLCVEDWLWDKGILKPQQPQTLTEDKEQ